MITAIMILSVVGFLLSLYTFFIERQLIHHAGYIPLCDISDVVSCTKPLLSPYAKLLGISNAVLGMIFYAGMFVGAWYGYADLVRYGALLAALASVIFAYILYFRIYALCIICTLIYVVNVVLVYCAYVM